MLALERPLFPRAVFSFGTKFRYLSCQTLKRRGCMKRAPSRTITRLQQDMLHQQAIVEELRAKGEDCIEAQIRLARATNALEMLR